YAQILPELVAGDGPALPMAVFTKEIEEAGPSMPFYIAVFAPRDPTMFASVAAIRAGAERRAPGRGEVELMELEDGDSAQIQHWAEFDLFGCPDGGLGDAGALASYAILHGVWGTAARGGSCRVPLPPAPQPSAQWILEVLSRPLAQDLDAGGPLHALSAEIGRLDAWVECWAAGDKWMAARDGEAGPFRPHPWQQAAARTDDGEDQTETLDDPATAADPSPTEAAQMLARHREAFGKRIDEFIDASIYDARGSAAAGQQARADGACALEGFPAREGLDFTERLWSLAHHAHDASDLSEAMAAVAEGLETGRLQPFIHHGNRSPLALAVRQALQMAQATTLVEEEAERERLAAQLDAWVDGQPLDPFVHSGVHKLRADFWFYFVGGRLATPRQVEPFLDLDLEPRLLVTRFRLLLRALGVWWLLRQAAPGMPRQFLCQALGALLGHFAAQLPALDLQPGSEADGAATNCDDPLRIVVFLPVYSSEVQDFVAAVAGSFDPARYTVAAADARRTRYSLRCLATTPALFDQQFAPDDAPIDDASDADGPGEEYTVFEATHL
ncbi:hypothetical protein H4R18_003924, partial [Coemansia javaensis]